MSNFKKRNSNDFENENHDTNCKRTKFAFNSHENGCLHNEIGIMHFNAGQHADAKRSFVEALKRERDVKLSSLKSNEIQTLLKDGPRAAGLCAELSSPKCELTEKIHSYIYQRHEYDEGMNVYTATLHSSISFAVEVRCATLLYNIGLTCASSNDYEEAVKWFELALEVIGQCENLPNDHDVVNFVKIHNNLGRCHYRKGQNEKSMKHYRCALAHTRELDFNKQDLAAAYNCVAVIQFHTPTEIKDALELLRKSLSIYRQLPGDFSREIGTLLNNIGRVHYVLFEYKKALDVLEKALKIRCEVLGNGSIDVAATVLNIAQTNHMIGELDKAMIGYRECADLIGSRLGPSNRDIATAYKGMARIYVERDEKKNARSLFEQALELERTTFGNLHTQLASTINEIGSLCYKMNDIDAALLYFQEGLKIEKASATSNRHNIIIALKNIAQIQRDNSDFDEAIAAYKEAKSLQVQVYGKSSPEVASTVVSLGLMHYLRQDFLSSLNFYQEALVLRREHYGSDDHHDVASTLNFIGLVMYRLRKYDYARAAFFQSLNIWQKLGEINEDISNLWYNMATVSLEVGDEEEAIKFYWESLRVEETILGDENPELCSTLQHLGYLYQRRGEFDNAIKCLTRALDIQRNNSKGKTPFSAIKLLNMIGNINLMKGNVNDMMGHYVEATRLSILSEEEDQEFQSLVVAGHNFYALSKLHPACAEAA